MNEEEKLDREYTKEETDKRCPQCGGTMNFSPETGGLLCPFCEHKEEISASDSAEELDFYAAESVENCDWGAEKKNVVCESCGAELIYDELELSSKCPYCDSNLVMQESAWNTLAPGGVCPFKITKEQAKHSFLSWIKGKLFCPSAAKKAAKAKELTGVYLPYWTFDCDTDSDYTARYSRTRTVRRNGKTHTVTTWHSTFGRYRRFFDDAEICGTERYNNDILAQIEPFDTENNVGYKPEYVAGFAAERYSVGLKDAWQKAKDYIKGLLKRDVTQKIMREHMTTGVNILSLDTTYSNIKYKYLLLPVWISSYKYKGKTYQFMVNGRTGKVGGKYPLSFWKILIAVLSVLAVIAVLYFIFMYGEGGDIYY